LQKIGRFQIQFDVVYISVWIDLLPPTAQSGKRAPITWQCLMADAVDQVAQVGIVVPPLLGGGGKNIELRAECRLGHY
jgi:hypothetical protein